MHNNIKQIVKYFLLKEDIRDVLANSEETKTKYTNIMKELSNIESIEEFDNFILRSRSDFSWSVCAFYIQLKNPKLYDLVINYITYLNYEDFCKSLIFAIKNNINNLIKLWDEDYTEEFPYNMSYELHSINFHGLIDKITGYCKFFFNKNDYLCINSYFYSSQKNKLNYKFTSDLPINNKATMKNSIKELVRDLSISYASAQDLKKDLFNDKIKPIFSSFKDVKLLYKNLDI